MSLSILWDLLSQVKFLRLHAVSLNPRQAKWSGTAEGRVRLTEISPDALIFSESGEWNFAEKPRIKFFNIYRWQRRPEEGVLELSHLRNGMDSPPVHLLDFEKTGDTHWHSKKPHVCREDLYAAVLSVEENLIRLKWTIDGPEKQQTVECFYE